MPQDELELFPAGGLALARRNPNSIYTWTIAVLFRCQDHRGSTSLTDVLHGQFSLRSRARVVAHMRVATPTRIDGKHIVGLALGGDLSH